jgi:hypothetical protein
MPKTQKKKSLAGVTPLRRGMVAVTCIAAVGERAVLGQAQARARSQSWCVLLSGVPWR